MKFNRLVYFSFSALIAIGLASCGQSSSDKTKNSKEFNDADSLQEQLEELAYSVPQPSEIPYLLQGTGAKIRKTLITPENGSSQ